MESVGAGGQMGVILPRARLLGLAVGSMWPRALELMEMEATPSEWWPSAGEFSNDSLFVSGSHYDLQVHALLVSLAKACRGGRAAPAAHRRARRRHEYRRPFRRNALPECHEPPTDRQCLYPQYAGCRLLFFFHLSTLGLLRMLNAAILRF